MLYQSNVEQDHNVVRDGGRIFDGSGRSRGAIVPPFQRAKSKNLSANLLRQQDLLRDIAKEHGSAHTAAGESRFQRQSKRDLHRPIRDSFAESGSWQSTLFVGQCRL